MNFPTELRYTKDHEWVLFKDGIATIGITEFAQSELGELVFVDLPSIGKSVKQKDSICVVESTKAASDVYAPVSGKVYAVNTKLQSNPELVNNSSYTDGWLVQLSGVPSSEVEGLMSADQYRAMVGEK